jgi:predicted ATP-dependent endonuclease of OLD family
VVEEPELFLHPHAQRRVASLLRKIANEPSTHVILTTHSASILAQTDMLDVVRVDRDDSGGTRCCRLMASYDGLDTWERTLTGDFAEMFFADRVVLVEGPSETIILPRIATAISGTGGESIDPDRYNVSFINVGGKDKFHIFTSLLDEMRIEWRIVTDKDALAGDTLDEYKKRTGIKASMTDREQCCELLKVGVAVLTKGEIEDYYPVECLAEIAGCSQEETREAIARRRMEFEDPTAMQLAQTIVLENRQAICESNAARLPKLIQCWYSQSVQRLREGDALGQTERKTGDVLTLWLKKGKPEIAQRASEWMLSMPDRVPADLQRLVKWLVLGGRGSPEPANAGGSGAHGDMA